MAYLVNTMPADSLIMSALVQEMACLLMASSHYLNNVNLISMKYKYICL